MKYEMVEVDPEFDQSNYLYVLMVKNPYGYDKYDKWDIVMCAFRQSEIDKRVEELSNRESVTEKRNLKQEEIGVLKIKLPPNVNNKSWVEPGKSL